MKKIFAIMLVLCCLLAGCTSQTTSTPTESTDTNTSTGTLKDGTYTGTGSGYGGELSVEVTVAGGKISGVSVTDHHESSPVFNRAMPMLEERIVEANTPIVDSVTAATFTSFAVKSAVGEALKEAGADFGSITMNTTGPAKEATTIDDVTTDIVIVGGGPAGLAAAITAKQTNPDVNVLVIEKLDILSGNGKFDLNFYDVFNSEAQKAAGVEDSVEKFIEDMKDAGNTPERLQVWAEGESVVDAWLRDMGTELNHYYGDRNHMVDKDTYAGETIQDNMEKEAYKLGVEIRTGTKGEDLIFDGDKVVGVSVTNNNLESYNINAQKVIIATGGFCSSPELLAEYAPGYEVLITSNQIGTTGDFVKVFEKYGFQMDHMDTIRVIPSVILPSRDLTNSGAGTIFVNENGERFVNERSGGLDMGTAILAQPNGVAWSIADTTKVEKNANVRKQVKAGKWLMADSLEELADLMGVDKDTFVTTVEAYNALAEAGTEDEFGQTPERPFDAEGPYYAVKTNSANHMTKGGVVCNELAQIIGEDGNPVDGLYGAGEVTWQSGGYSQSVVFGRIAGQQAAEALAK